MIITTSMPLTTTYDNDGLGYGGFVITLPLGTQEVDDNFGAFLLANHSDIVSEGTVAPVVTTSDDVASAASTAIDSLQSENADLTAKLAAAESALASANAAEVTENPEVISSVVEPVETPVEDAAEVTEEVAV